jgi:voltage-gated potassium channel Kch
LDAIAVVLTIPDDEQTIRACRVIRSIRPDVVIAARTATLSRANLARQQGVDEVVVEELATAREMSACLIRRFARTDPKQA